jgi:hypothetical protein
MRRRWPATLCINGARGGRVVKIIHVVSMLAAHGERQLPAHKE